MDIYETTKDHTSIREYKDEDLKDGDLEKILDAARHAPSSINGQQWSVIVIKDKENKKKLAHLVKDQEWVEDCPVFLVFVADYNKAAIALEKEGKEFKNIDSIDSTIVSSVDIGIAFSNAMNVSETLGYGIVPIGAIRINPKEVIDILKLPKYVYPIVGMCIGVPDEDPIRKPIFPKEAMVHEETYNKDLRNVIDEYDEIIKQYRNERTNGEDVRSWSQGVAGDYSQIFFPRVYDTLKEQGFKNNK